MNKTHEFPIGDSKVVITCHKNPNGGYWEDSSVEFGGNFLCAVSWEDREKFQEDFLAVITKHRI